MLEATAAENRDSLSKEDRDLDSVQRKSRGALFAKRKFSQPCDTALWCLCTSRPTERKGKRNYEIEESFSESLSRVDTLCQQ